jgi:hypothetical protein
MSYLNCPRCRLAVHSRADRAAPESCPRCRGRLGVSIPMFPSRYPYYRRLVTDSTPPRRPYASPFTTR